MTNPATYTNPWEDPVISAVFTPTSGTTSTVGGFYYSANTWKLRFAPKQIGNYTWSLSYADTGGTYQTSGSFASTASTNSGFLRISGTNPLVFVTEANGSTFYAHGFNIPLPANSKHTDPASITDLSQTSFPTSNYAQPTTLAQFLSTSSNAGFNMLREMNSGDGFYHLMTFNSGSTGKNLYDMNQGVLCDELMAALHSAGWKCLMTFWADPANYVPSYTLSAGSTITQACERYHQYIMNRYGAYVDIWELCNENSGVPQAYSDSIISYVHGNDPYRHLITISYAQSYHSEFDLETEHEYLNVQERAVPNTIANAINSLTGPDSQALVIGEAGNGEPYGAYDPERFRFYDWAAFFNRGMVLYWNGGYKDSYQEGSGPANQYIGWEERSDSKIMTDFMSNFDPAARPIATSLAPGGQMVAYALASATDLGLYIEHETTVNAVLKNATVTLNVPGNNMQGWWIDPASGNLLEAASANAGSQKFSIPPFISDIALRLRAAGSQPAIQFSTPSYNVLANQGSVTLTVYRVGGVGSAISVNYTTSDGLAKAGVDYTASSGVLNWGAAERQPASDHDSGALRRHAEGGLGFYGEFKQCHRWWPAGQGSRDGCMSGHQRGGA